MAWRVMVCNTVDGAVVGELPYTDLAWSDSLDVSKGANLTVTVPLDEYTLPRVRSVAQGPWRHTLLVAYHDVAVVAGPLITHEVNPEQTAVALGCAGPTALLAARTVIRPGHELSPDAAGADSSIGPSTLAGLAKLLVEQAATVDGSTATGVLLPLQVPAGIPEGAHVRNWEAADLADYAERLDQLSTVENGPEVHFRPVLDHDEQHMWWQVRIGTPRLGSDVPWTWTLGGNCEGIGVDYDASAMAHRVYTAGRTETLVPSSGLAPPVTITTIGVAQDLELLGLGWPLLERVDRGVGTGADDHAPARSELDAQAREFLRIHSRPTETWKVTVRADQHPRLGSYALGDPARLIHYGHRWLGEGASERRIIGHSSDGSDTTVLELSETPGLI